MRGYGLYFVRTTALVKAFIIFEIFATLHPSHLILFIEVAEVFRRAMWNIFRIEWEIIVKQNILTVAKNTDEYSDQDDMIALIDRSQGKISPHKEMV